MILTTITGTKQLRPDAADSWFRQVRDGMPPNVTSAWRDPVYQQWLVDQYKAGVDGFNFALPPDQSMHCLGLAIDVPENVQDWLAASGAGIRKPNKYGWYRLEKEEHHYQYDPAHDDNTQGSEDDMLLIMRKGRSVYVLKDGPRTDNISRAGAEALEAAGMAKIVPMPIEDVEILQRPTEVRVIELPKGASTAVSMPAGFTGTIILEPK